MKASSRLRQTLGVTPAPLPVNVDQAHAEILALGVVSAAKRGSLAALEHAVAGCDPLPQGVRIFIAADTDDPGIKQVLDAMGDDNIVLSTDFGPSRRMALHARRR